MANEYYEDEGDVTVTLTLDDDSELECIVLTTFPAGGKEYIALLPTTGTEAELGEVFLYRYLVNEDGSPALENILEDDEYEIAADAFDEYLDSQEYDEYVSADEESDDTFNSTPED